MSTVMAIAAHPGDAVFTMGAAVTQHIHRGGAGVGERYNVQFRAEFYNLFNTPSLTLGTGSSVTLNTAQFGKILSGGSPRNIQLGLRILFWRPPG